MLCIGARFFDLVFEVVQSLSPCWKIVDAEIVSRMRAAKE
jgi:hypothetical protein